MEATLVESGSSFAIDSSLLLRLDDAGTPVPVIDLMMALSYPDYFAVEDQRAATPTLGYDPYWAPWFYGYHYGFYGHHHRHHDRPPHGPGGPRRTPRVGSSVDTATRESNPSTCLPRASRR